MKLEVEDLETAVRYLVASSIGFLCSRLEKKLASEHVTDRCTSRSRLFYVANGLQVLKFVALNFEGHVTLRSMVQLDKVHGENQTREDMLPADF